MRAGAVKRVVLLVGLASSSSGVELESGRALEESSKFAPNFRADSNLIAEKIRQDVMGREGFSKIVPPTSDRAASGADYSGSGTDVFLQIRVFKVQVVNAAEGWMRLKICLLYTSPSPRDS